MIGTRVPPSIRIALHSFMLCGVVTATRCSSDLTDSLEGRACDENGKCLRGYECDTTRNICVAESERDSENTDAGVESVVDSEVGGDAERGFDSSVDAGAETGLDSSAEGGTVNSNGGDSEIEADAGTDARPCGYEIEPPGMECPAACDSCLDGVCFINCELEQECSGAHISCPEGFACNVACSDKRACEKAIISCPLIYNCSVSCTAEQSCKLAKIKCGEDGPCALDCESGTETCLDAELQCKNQACKASCGSDQIPPNIKNCHVSCSSQCGC
jgi:hypothetical protein